MGRLLARNAETGKLERFNRTGSGASGKLERWKVDTPCVNRCENTLTIGISPGLFEPFPDLLVYFPGPGPTSITLRSSTDETQPDGQIDPCTTIPASFGNNIPYTKCNTFWCTRVLLSGGMPNLEGGSALFCYPPGWQLGDDPVSLHLCLVAFYEMTMERDCVCGDWILTLNFWYTIPGLDDVGGCIANGTIGGTYHQVWRAHGGDDNPCVPDGNPDVWEVVEGFKSISHDDGGSTTETDIPGSGSGSGSSPIAELPFQIVDVGPSGGELHGHTIYGCEGASDTTYCAPEGSTGSGSGSGPCDTCEDPPPDDVTTVNITISGGAAVGHPGLDGEHELTYDPDSGTCNFSGSWDADDDSGETTYLAFVQCDSGGNFTAVVGAEDFDAIISLGQSTVCCCPHDLSGSSTGGTLGSGQISVTLSGCDVA